jgi:hypothetical protein
MMDRAPLSAAATAAWSGPITLIGDAAHPVTPSLVGRCRLQSQIPCCKRLWFQRLRL